MSKKIKGFIIAFISTFVVIIILYAAYMIALAIAFRGDTTETLLMSSQSPYGAYTVEIREVGEAWLFGPSTVAIWIQNSDGKEKKFCETTISNDGSSLREDENYRIEWSEDSAVIKLDGCEQSEETVRVKITDFEFS